MILTILSETDAPHNLACEEALFTNAQTDERFILWRNRSAVIVGRHQNTRAETDVDYAAAHDIQIVRRMTGGGAVYHDLGNVNFSVIQPYSGSLERSFVCAAMIVDYLRGLGIPAETRGRNDLVVDGRKCSGHAQTVRDGRILYHGTILFDTDIDLMTRVLTVGEAKYAGRGVASVQARVVNLRAFLPDWTAEDFWSDIGRYFSDRLTTQPLSDDERASAAKLTATRYGNWDWNFGQSPKYTFTKTARFSAGTVQVYADVANGVLVGLRICGDFFSQNDPALLEQALCGKRHDAAALREALSGLPVSETILGLTAEELLSVLV